MKKFAIEGLIALGMGILAMIGIGLMLVKFPEMDGTTRGWLSIVGLVILVIAGKYLR